MRSSESNSEKVLGIEDILHLVFEYKFTFIFVVSFFLSATYIYAKSLPNIYETSAKVLATDNANNTAQQPGLSNLASFAGIRISGGQVDQTAIALERLRSRKYLISFVKRNDLLPELFAVNRFDDVTNSLIYDEDMFDSKSRLWLISEDSQYFPTDWDIVENMLNSLTLTRDDRTQLVTIRYQHESPVFAERLLNVLINDINEISRKRELEEAKRSIEFLEMTLSRSSVESINQSLYEMLEQQYSRVSFAESRPDFLFTILDPAMAPRYRAYPNRPLMMIVGLILGGGSAFILIFAVHTYRLRFRRKSS